MSFALDPDGLRAYLVEHAPWVRADLIEPFADAWEAMDEAFGVDRNELDNANAALRELLRDLDGGLDDYWCENNPEVITAFHAALVGEEKP